MRQPSQGRHAPDRSSATYTGQLIRSLHKNNAQLQIYLNASILRMHLGWMQLRGYTRESYVPSGVLETDVWVLFETDSYFATIGETSKMSNNQIPWVQTVTNMIPLNQASLFQWQNTHPQIIAQTLGWDSNTLDILSQEYTLAHIRAQYIAQNVQMQDEDAFQSLHFGQNTQLRDEIVILLQNSPTFRSIIRRVAAAGPVTIGTTPMNPSAPNHSSWTSQTRHVSAVRNPKASSAAFELINASSSGSLLNIQAAKFNGQYARDQSGNLVSPDQAAVRYAQDIERLEWNNARTHHQIMLEVQNNGIPLPQSYDRYGRGFTPGHNGAPGRWDSFQNYLNDQIPHTQLYIDKYMRDMGHS
jgi:hypothetical protein